MKLLPEDLSVHFDTALKSMNACRAALCDFHEHLTAQLAGTPSPLASSIKELVHNVENLHQDMWILHSRMHRSGWQMQQELNQLEMEQGKRTDEQPTKSDLR